LTGRALNDACGAAGPCVQRGQTLVIFTIVSAFVLLGTIALVGNAQVLFVNANRADAAALLAAQAGASAIDPNFLYSSNQVVIAPALAVTRCREAGAQAQFVVSVDCRVSGNSVTATVVEQVQMPVPLWSGAETVRATRTARPAYGGITGGF
ncbi:MAG TPA: hypothetical protein VLW53_07265, partial [Candidatus Eisenbacteria bacterium]|nr:hypothetical protein [Candidatus Eisenbacteria bacterium]